MTMETLLKSITPEEAYEMFTQTYNYKVLPKMLDDASIHFFNVASLLKTTCVNAITHYINANPNENILDVLVIAYVKDNPYVLYQLQQDFIGMKENIYKKCIHLSKEIEKDAQFKKDVFFTNLESELAVMEAKYKLIKSHLYYIQSLITLLKML